MTRKVYAKPPAPTKTMFTALIVVASLFLVFGIGLFIGVHDELGEAMPFVAFFFVIWIAVCIIIIVHAVKTLRLIKRGKIEIAEIAGTDSAIGETESGFSERLRSLEALKRDGLISQDEYGKKRAEIMKEKW